MVIPATVIDQRNGVCVTRFHCIDGGRVGFLPLDTAAFELGRSATSTPWLTVGAN